MGHSKQHQGGPEILSSTKFWLNILSRTRLLVSVIQTESHQLKRKVSICTHTRPVTRTNNWVQEQNGGTVRSRKEGKRQSDRGAEKGYSKEYEWQSSRKSSSSSSRRRGHGKGKGGCYLCEINQCPSTSSFTPDLSPEYSPHNDLPPPPYQTILPSPNYALALSYPLAPALLYPTDASPQEISQYDDTHKERKQIYLPITRSQPPILPRRRSSLPGYKLGRKAQICKKHAEMNSIYSVLGNWGSRLTSHIDTTAQNEIWDQVLRVAWEEEGILQLVFAISRARGCVASRPSHATASTFNNLLARIPRDRKADGRTWEVVFMAVYLQTYLCVLRGEMREGRRWLVCGYQLLRVIVKAFGGEEKVPYGVRRVAELGFGRLVWV